MRANGTPARGLVVARGAGIKVRVTDSWLVVEDGIGVGRRVRRFRRTDRMTRLVVIGRSGYVSFEAIRWLYDVGASLVHIDPEGTVLASSTASGPVIPSLRRAQALASVSDAGLEAARMLLSAKVEGQASLLGDLPAGEASRLGLSLGLEEIRSARDVHGLLAGELRAAGAYWDAWAPLPVRVAPRKGRPGDLPEHWLRFGGRASLLTGAPRMATNPANALLNYLYALLSAETTLACQAVGLDPGLGIFHADRDHTVGRAAFSFDAMEAVRPAVDAYVLAILTQRTLRSEDFGETRKGACRISLTFAGELAETVSTWRELVAPYVERVAHILGGRAGSGPLTRAGHLAAWESRRPGHRRRKRAAVPSLPGTCRDCGSELPTRRHRYCEACRRRRWEENAPRARENAAAVLAVLRSEQRDPGHGGQAAKLRGAKNAAHQRAVREWEGDRPDPALFAAEILPGLRGKPISVLAAATGLSEHYCSLIRLGKRVPHPRHWDVLREV